MQIKIQGGAKVGLQLWVLETQSLFLYYYLLAIVLLFRMNNCKPTFALPSAPYIKGLYILQM